MNKIKSYKDLIVWQKAITLCTIVYDLTNTFPKNEMFGLTLQIRRAVISIPSNIAEGNGRNKFSKEYKQFLYIARGSLQEVETQLIIAEELGYVKNINKKDDTFLLLREIEKILNTIISRL